MLGFPTLYFKGRRLMMFQLSGFYCRWFRVKGFGRFRGLGCKGFLGFRALAA